MARKIRCPSPGHLHIAGGDLAIDDGDPLTIESDGGPATIDADNASRVFTIAAGATLRSPVW